MSRKLREAVITLEMEYYLPKERILEIYLNVAQFDDHVFGIREGARHHFKKEVRQLTLDETVTLICLLPAPTSWNIKKPGNAFLQHKRLVQRNYALYKGLKLEVDTLDMAQRDSVYSHLAEMLSEERWKTLRSRPYVAPEDSQATDSSSQAPKEDSRGQVF